MHRSSEGGMRRGNNEQLQVIESAVKDQPEERWMQEYAQHPFDWEISHLFQELQPY